MIRTVEGFNVPHVSIHADNGWGVARLATGHVYRGKREVLGQGFWNADTGEELLHNRNPQSRGQWALTAPIT